MSSVTDKVRPRIWILPRVWRATLRRWRANAAARRQLLQGQLRDPRLAKDIGLSDADLAREAHAQFWVQPRRSVDALDPH